MCPALYYSCGGCEDRGQHAWMLLEVAPHSLVVFVCIPCCAVTRHDSQCWNLCVAVADGLQWNSSVWPLACQIAAQVCFCSGPRHLSSLLIWIFFLYQSEARVQLCPSSSPPVFPITICDPLPLSHVSLKLGACPLLLCHSHEAFNTTTISAW